MPEGPQPLARFGLTPEVISAGLEAAHEWARQEGCAISVAITNVSGKLCGLVHAPDAFLASSDYAEWKAWTAASFGMPTAQFAELLRHLGEEVKDGLLAHPKATALAGGIPVMSGGYLICAIGVSGGSAEQDICCAKAAAAAVMQRLKASD